MKNSGVVSFVLFGGTGDLVRRKLVPAFAELICKGVINEKSKIIGVGRREMKSEDYRKMLVESIEDKDLRECLSKVDITYLSIDFSNHEEIEKIGEELKHCNIGGCNRLYYLATSFKFFSEIVKGLKKYGFNEESRGFTRIAFEKPFGSDLKSSNELDKQIHSVFKEDNIFRIDHYLAKKGVREILDMKINCQECDDIFDGKHIEEIEVVSNENIGVGKRLEYYNESGALRDMMQNHLLQVLSILLIDNKKVNDESIHDKKVRALKEIEFVNSKENLLGQYKSYKNELENVGLKDTKIETFAKILLKSKNENWKGVKIKLVTGKMLSDKKAYVKLKMKNEEEEIFDIYPDKNEGNEYSLLLKNILNGNKMLFATNEEIAESWRIIEDIEKQRDKINFVIYEDGKNV